MDQPADAHWFAGICFGDIYEMLEQLCIAKVSAHTLQDVYVISFYRDKNRLFTSFMRRGTSCSKDLKAKNCFISLFFDHQE